MEIEAILIGSYDIGKLSLECAFDFAERVITRIRGVDHAKPPRIHEVIAQLFAHSKLILERELFEVAWLFAEALTNAALDAVSIGRTVQVIGVRVNLTKIRHDVQNIANLVLDALRGSCNQSPQSSGEVRFRCRVAVGVGHLSVKDDF